MKFCSNCASPVVQRVPPGDSLPRTLKARALVPFGAIETMRVTESAVKPRGNARLTVTGVESVYPDRSVVLIV